MSSEQQVANQEVIGKNRPDYATLFGSVELCDCEHCRSIYSPAAYLVDLMQFLGPDNPGMITPLDVLIGNSSKKWPDGKPIVGRRPDIAHIQLSCENTNTTLPYVDLVNEVLESYIAFNQTLPLQTDPAGVPLVPPNPEPNESSPGVTSVELSANPENTRNLAYEKLSVAVFPFTLPFNQPMTSLRLTLEQMGSSRHELMTVFGKQNDDASACAQDVELLGLTEAEFLILTTKQFDGTPVTRPVSDFYGFEMSVLPPWVESLAHVPTMLARTGITYVELIDLVRVRFINPALPQGAALAAFERIPVSYAVLAELVASNFANPDAQTIKALAAANMTKDDLAAWASEHFVSLGKLIVLDAPDSGCDLTLTRLQHLDGTFLDDTELSRLHRFIRLWRKIGWSVQDLDRAIVALQASDITQRFLRQLGQIVQLQKRLELSPQQLLSFWGSIPVLGDDSLYCKLFLNKAVRTIDSKFEADDGEYLRSDPDEPLTIEEHLPALLAGLRTRAADLALIREHSQWTNQGADPMLQTLAVKEAPLTLATATILYRYVTLARALNMAVKDLIALQALSGENPFSTLSNSNLGFDDLDIDPARTLGFVRLADRVARSGFSPSTLGYLFNSLTDAPPNVALTAESTQALLATIREELVRIAAEHVVVDDPIGEVTRAKLGLLFEAHVIEQIASLIAGTQIHLAPLAAIPPGLALPAAAGKVTYNSGLLKALGWLTTEERDVLLTIPDTQGYHAAVRSLHDQPRELLNETLVRQLGWKTAETDLSTSVFEPTSYVKGELSSAIVAAKFKMFLTCALPYFRKALSRGFVKQTLADALTLEPATAALLLEGGDGVVPLGTDADHATPAIADFLALVGDGLTATDFDNETWADPGQPARVDPGINSQWKAKHGFSVRWEGKLLAEKTQRYQFHLRSGGSVKLTIDGQPQPLTINQSENTTAQEFTAAVEMKAGESYGLKLEYSNHSVDALIELRWSGPATPAELVPSYRLYSTIRDDVATAAERTLSRLHKASMLISSFKLSAIETSFLADPAQANALKLNSLPVETTAVPSDQRAMFAAWVNWADYTALRAVATLEPIALLEVLRSTSSILARAAIVRATGWTADTLEKLAGAEGLDLKDTDYVVPGTLLKLVDAMQLAARLGAPASEVLGWAASAPDFKQASAAAQEARRGHKAQYDNEAWLEIARSVTDRLRERQRSALVVYLQEHFGFTDPAQLFEQFLIDVEMSPCMQTSRIKQAISSVQLFIQRCRMNIEQHVWPKMIDNDRWQWMQNYRVWEANLKVFLYPENWIEPELRDDKSPFFRELESELLQTDVTTETAEIAIGNYLEKLDTVAQLQICGMYEELDEKEGIVLHVFGHTFAAPRVFYYRRLVTVNPNYRYWTPWEHVPLDIPADEVLPVIWNRRLYVFWQVLTKKQVVLNRDAIAKRTKTDKAGLAQPEARTECRLAWSDYRQGKWSPKRMTSPDQAILVGDEPARLARQLSITQNISELTISLWTINDFIKAEDQYSRQTDWFERTHLGSLTFNNSNGQVTATSNVRMDSNLLGFMPYVATELEFATPFVFEPRIPVLGQSPASNVLRLFGSGAHPYTLNDYFFMQEGLRAYLVLPSSAELSAMERLLHTEEIDPYTPGSAATKPPGVSPDIGWQVQAQLSQLSTKSNPWLSGRAGIAATEIRAFSTPAPASQSVKVPALSMDSEIFHHGVIKAGERIERFPAEFRFETFFHPYTAEFQRRLNRDGVPGLLNLDSQRPESLPKVKSFADAYAPDWRTVKSPLPVHDVDFNFRGAYSLYNWEIFFHVPLFLATRLSQNQRFEEAMNWFHYIFNPTAGSPADPVSQRYWNVLPLRETQPQRLDKMLQDLHAGIPDVIAQWEDLQKHPFQPHRVARLRRIAYQKTVVMKYIDNLISWGDQLFRRDTIESINQATQLFVLAGTLLGPRIQRIPPRGRMRSRTYAELRRLSLDKFNQAMVSFENDLPFSSRTTSGESSTESTGLLGIGRTFYFCLPKNEKLLGYWDTVADRLFKIRHCMNIEGVVRELPLFEPAIDPALLVQAAAQGIDLSSVLNDLSAPLPYYRFNSLLAKAFEMTGELRGLGSALLAALEKRDAEHISNVRATHETELLSLVKQVKQLQLAEAQAAETALQQSRDVTQTRFDFYSDIPQRIDEETNQLKQLEEGRKFQRAGQTEENTASDIVTYTPDTSTGWSYTTATGWSQKADTTIGRANVISYYQAKSRVNSYEASIRVSWANDSSILGSWKRRSDDWKLQKDLAFKELAQIDKQLTAAGIRIDIAQQELDNTTRQIEQSLEIQDFLRNKYTGEELYGWMVGGISTVFFQCYQLAYDLAKKAERCFRFELGLTKSNFVQFGAWDSMRKGLLSGERLYLQLKQMEHAYLDRNRREYELTKHYSLVQNDPSQLIRLKELGSCEIELPETLFDIDFPGHYMRRIKSVSLTIPAVVGPYTGVNCTLTLLRDKTRVKSTPVDGYPERDGEEDDRFLTSWTRMQAIATSSGQNDSGMFELNFRDERYLPFEGAGVISKWRIELPTDFRQFDYDTISDVVLHVKYTAREGGVLLRNAAVSNLQQQLKVEASKPQARLFSLRHEFPAEWQRLQSMADSNGNHSQAFSLAKHRFPFVFHGRTITVKGVEIFGIAKDRKDAPTGIDTLRVIPAGGVLPVSDEAITDTLEDTLRVIPAGGVLPGTALVLKSVKPVGLLVHLESNVIDVEVKTLGEKKTEADWTIQVNKDDVPKGLDLAKDILLLCHYAVDMPITTR